MGEIRLKYDPVEVRIQVGFRWSVIVGVTE